MMEQSERQRREMERTEIVIENTEMVRNRRECHGKAGERWRRSEKIRYMTFTLYIYVLIINYIYKVNTYLFNIKIL